MMLQKEILLVEDDVDDQLIFKDALSEIATGVECIVANNGLEALDFLKQRKAIPAILFVDLNMPLMNGFELLECLKKGRILNEIPVVIFTTSNSPHDKQRAKELGAQMFFTKTADFRLLKINLASILGNFRILKEAD